MLITGQLPIPRQLDDVVFDCFGLLVGKSEVDLSIADRIDGFAIEKNIPANTDIKVVFFLNNVWCKVTGVESGLLVPIATQTLTAETVLAEGNSIWDLERYTSVPDLLGKKFKVAIALWAESPDVVPKIKLGIKCRSAANQYVKTVTSELFAFAQESEITSISQSVIQKDGGTVEVLAKLRKANGDASEWEALSAVKGQLATGIQFQGTLSVSDIGKSLAQLSTVATEYSPANGIVGAGTVDIVSITENWNIPLASVRMMVRHKRLRDSILRGYVAFRTTPVAVIGEIIGVGNGEWGSYDVSHKNGIHQDTVKVYFDGVRQYSGHNVNAASGRIHCAAPEGAVIVVDYEYGWNLEVWEELRRSAIRPGVDYDTTEFRYERPLLALPASICATKVSMETVGGHAEGENIGVGVGAVRTYMLQHIARAWTMCVYVDGVQQPPSAFIVAEDGCSVRLSAPKKAIITVDYDWISETPAVYQFVSLFAE